MKCENIPSKVSNKKKYLKHIHFFRGFAIINIAFVHLAFIRDKSILGIHHSDYVAFMEVIFHGATIYFLFISGFLFHYLSDGFNMKKYYYSKIKFVFIPYVIISSLVVIVNHFYDIENLGYVDFFKTWLISIVFGTAQIQYWYIPFIMLVYLVSPYILLIPNKVFKYLAPLIFILPLLGTRTGAQVSVWQFLYFGPVYLLGIYTSMDYNKVLEVINKLKYLFVVVAIVSTLFLILQYKLNVIDRYGIFSIQEGLFYIQKISITVLVLLAFRNFENSRLYLFDELAKLSFGIYFTHLFINYFFYNFKIYLVEFLISENYSPLIIPVVLLYATMLLFINVWILKLSKKILGQKSRMILGV
ncbi:acyltransferase family protein [Saccharicrinis aurantiacus]|uniref:acyltransferase family protein n=1 Tax=Saccharicrinis aurantiacus TaxID=1849719 RepID=UPI002490E032|nr:acyltransferase [Saccharicrinis aurantiacus]